MVDGQNNCVCLAQEYFLPLYYEAYTFDTGDLVSGTTSFNIKTFNFSTKLLFMSLTIHETTGAGKGIIVRGQILHGRDRTNIVSVYKDRNTDFELSAGQYKIEKGRYFQINKGDSIVLQLVPLTDDTYRIIGAYGY